MPLSRSRDYLSIGEVLEAIKADFPDISISKIRFLESEGLINPERTASGYRKFYELRRGPAPLHPVPAAGPLPAPEGHHGASGRGRRHRNHR